MNDYDEPMHARGAYDYDYAGYLPTHYAESNELSGHKRNCAYGAGGDCTCGVIPWEAYEDPFIGPIQECEPTPAPAMGYDPADPDDLPF